MHRCPDPWRACGFVLAVALAACGGTDDGTATPSTAARLGGTVRTPPLDVGDVVLPDESSRPPGQPFVTRAAPGELLLVYFGYTTCPDICPTTFADIGAALRELPGRRESVDVAFVTVDPARDTGEVMNSYLDHFVDGGHALRTTDTEVLRDARDAFRVVARRVDEGDDGYSFEHTAVTYVVDEGGTVALEWPFGTTAADMTRDLALLFDAIEESPRQKEP